MMYSVSPLMQLLSLGIGTKIWFLFYSGGAFSEQFQHKYFFWGFSTNTSFVGIVFSKYNSSSAHPLITHTSFFRFHFDFLFNECEFPPDSFFCRPGRKRQPERVLGAQVQQGYHQIQHQIKSHRTNPPAMQVRESVTEQSRCCWHRGCLMVGLLSLNKTQRLPGPNGGDVS